MKKNLKRIVISIVVITFILLSISLLVILRQYKIGIQYTIISIIFVISSFVLLFNNLTDFFKKLKIKLPINIIVWISMIFSIIWFIIIQTIRTT